MTESAINVSSSGKNNIEAGIIFPLSKNSFENIVAQCRPLNNLHFMNEDELDREKPEIETQQELIWSRVAFNWLTLQYTITLDEICMLNDYSIRLPDVGTRKILYKTLCIINVRPSELVKDHYYYVLKNDRIIKSGVIVELEPLQRPGWRFNSLNELFFSYISDTIPQSSEKQCISYGSKLDEIPETGDFVSPLSDGVQLSYVSMFKAFSHLRKKLDDVMDTFSINPAEYYGYIQSYPGSLLELAEKIEKHLSNPEMDQSMVFSWFMVRELNNLIYESIGFLKKQNDETAKTHSEILEKNILDIPSISDGPLIDKYLRYICKTCKYHG